VRCLRGAELTKQGEDLVLALEGELGVLAVGAFIYLAARLARRYGLLALLAEPSLLEASLRGNVVALANRPDLGTYGAGGGA
jgi:hypothetical protein